MNKKVIPLLWKRGVHIGRPKIFWIQKYAIVAFTAAAILNKFQSGENAGIMLGGIVADIAAAILLYVIADTALGIRQKVVHNRASNLLRIAGCVFAAFIPLGFIVGAVPALCGALLSVTFFAMGRITAFANTNKPKELIVLK